MGRGRDGRGGAGMTAVLLPPGFEALAPFIDRWAVDTTAARLHARSTASMAEIRAFYDAMLPQAEAAIICIDQHDIRDLPAGHATLAKLVLSLAQAAVAVEMHGQPVSPGTPYPNSVRIPQGIAPFG
jgi:hypothetical protein